MLLGGPASKPGRKHNKSPQVKRGVSIDSNLASALKAQGDQLAAGRTKTFPLDKLAPNPDNKRIFRVGLSEMQDVLQMFSDAPLVYVEESGHLVFPEHEDLHHPTALAWSKRQVSFYTRIRELACSIQEHKGLLQPLEVFPHDDLFMLNIGHRRWYSAHFTGIDKLEAAVREKVNESALQSATRRYDENSKREDLCLYENIESANQIAVLMAQELGRKPKQVELARALSISKSEMSFLQRILTAELSEAEMQLILDHELEDLRTVAEICRLSDPEQRGEVFQAYIKHGNTVARNMVLRLLEAEDGDGTLSVTPPKRAVQIKPTKGAVKHLVTLLQGVQPDLVAGLDDQASPKEILSSILSRLDDFDKE
ncbi:ParB N-terminal domain-containing protein [uncultured Amphritea sp.]|uniref:ParB/RepB/Spo0J family partition protein n=1 Tax=uncultured Amphritea sp. TaxID=981605 RepID=UPI0026234129|nr:ParB N-terminal domain-containing protein [uncultured Amphritea sp.]